MYGCFWPNLIHHSHSNKSLASEPFHHTAEWRNNHLILILNACKWLFRLHPNSAATCGEMKFQNVYTSRWLAVERTGMKLFNRYVWRNMTPIHNADTNRSFLYRELYSNAKRQLLHRTQIREMIKLIASLLYMVISVWIHINQLYERY